MVIVEEAGKAVAKHVVGKAVARYFGMPLTAAMTIISARQTFRSRKKLKEFETQYVAPLQEEYGKWLNCKGNIEEAVRELTDYRGSYVQSPYPMDMEALIGKPHGDIGPMHYADPSKSYDYVVAAKNSLDASKDEGKAWIQKRLGTIEDRLYEINQVSGQADHMQAALTEVLVDVTHISSNYMFDIKAMTKDLEIKQKRWMIATVASAAGTVLSLGGLLKKKA
ncbi:hypothetical protein H6503_06985 [Candidatus Woesearchaeota archaeon]|nr:hypothetical protein [Candidatus Woesearchaeota archaeon]